VASPQFVFAVDQESISSSRVLLCEGSGDKNFFQELIRLRNLPGFYVTHPRDKIDAGGRSGFAQRLRGLRLQPGFEGVRGLVVASDNDRDPNASFEQVRTLIHDAEFKAPNHPYVVAAGDPVVSVMMVPAGNEAGQLETLCLRAIHDAWPEQFQCAESYAECAGISAWSVGKRERAKLRALVSHICKKDPNSSLTHLWHDSRELVIPLDNPCFDSIANFLGGFDASIAAAG
jgi:hypothetical protein